VHGFSEIYGSFINFIRDAKDTHRFASFVVVLKFALLILYYKNGRNSMGVKIVISKALLNLKLVYYKN
jgi:hypothetical protein